MEHVKQRLWTKDFLIVSAINFFLTLIFYLLMVTIAMYAVEEYGATTSEAGLATGIFIIGALFGRLVAGRVIENVGRKKLLLIGLIFITITTFLYFGVNGLIFLLINRLVHGLAFGIVSTATGTIVAQIIPESRRGEGVGYYSLSVTLATAIGPFLGLYLSQNTDYSVLIVLCVILVIFSLISSFFLHVPITHFSKEQVEEMKRFKLSNFIEPASVPISFISMIAGFCYSSVLSFLSFYTVEIDLVEASSFFFIVYAIVILCSRPFTGRLFDLKGPNIIMYPAFLLYAVGLLVLSQVQNGVMLMVAGAIIGLGFGNFQSSAQAIAIKRAPSHRAGLATSTFFIFTDIGFGIGPYVLGFIIPSLGYKGLYLAMAAIAFCMIIIYYFLHGKKAHTLKEEASYQL